MFRIAGTYVSAPGFTVQSFDRAVHRAHMEGLRLEPTTQPRMVAATSGTTDGVRYLVTRDACTCKAGQHGIPCKHIAFAVFLHDVCGLDITKPGMPPRAGQPAAEGSIA